MYRKLAKKVCSTAVGMVTGIMVAGGNLQTLVLGATPLSGVATNARLKRGTYSISSPQDLATLEELVNGGYAVGSGLKFMLTGDIDLTEGGSYLNGYCDKPIYKDGKVTGWCEMASDGSGSWKETGNGGGAIYQ